MDSVGVPHPVQISILVLRWLEKLGTRRMYGYSFFESVGIVVVRSFIASSSGRTQRGTQPVQTMVLQMQADGPMTFTSLSRDRDA